MQELVPLWFPCRYHTAIYLNSELRLLETNFLFSFLFFLSEMRNETHRHFFCQNDCDEPVGVTDPVTKCPNFVCKRKPRKAYPVPVNALNLQECDELVGVTDPVTKCPNFVCKRKPRKLYPDPVSVIRVWWTCRSNRYCHQMSKLYLQEKTEESIPSPGNAKPLDIHQVLLPFFSCLYCLPLWFVDHI